MDLFNTQCSQSIFSLDATICPRKRAENVTTGEGLRCANRHSNRAHWPIKVIIIIFSKIIKISKNHVSISKLGALGHTSSIFFFKKKEIIFFLKCHDFQKSCINLQTRGIRPCLIHFQKKKNQDFQKSCIHF